MYHIVMVRFVYIILKTHSPPYLIYFNANHDKLIEVKIFLKKCTHLWLNNNMGG